MSKTESEILFPKGKELEIAGETLLIEKMRLHQIVKGTGKLGGVFDLAYAAFLSDGMDNAAIFKIFETDGDNVLDFIAIALNKDRSFVDNLDMEEAIEVLIAIVEVNADFFVSKVMPMMTKRAVDLKQLKQKTSKTRTQT